MDKNELLKRIDHVISLGQSTLATRQSSKYSSDYVDSGKQMGFRTAALSFIKSLYGESHIFYTDFEDRVNGQSPYETEKGINILMSIRHEIEHDWLTSIQHLVTAEIFSDFLEMSRHLLDNKYKDPAAVMIGSVLEEHLKRLCINHSVDLNSVKGADIIPKKADLLNADLVKAGVYGVLEQKNVTAWLDLRNRAAHGKYTEFTIDHVELMYLGVMNFVTTKK
ncbi:MAG: hypothetical protein ACXVPN_03880 [Bacteroidia bacterium]